MNIVKEYKNLDSLVTNFWTDSHDGILHIEDALTESRRERILEEMKGHETYPNPNGEGFLEIFRKMQNLKNEFPTIYSLYEDFNEAYQALTVLNENPGGVNRVQVQKHPRGESHGRHKDIDTWRNLSAVFNIRDRAPFYYWTGKDEDERHKIATTPGDLILVRQNVEGREDLRTYHGRGEVSEPRYEVVMSEEVQ